MGGKSGGGQRTPYEAPNSLSGAQSLRIIDAVSEGVVSGFAHGDDAPFKSVYFDDTPVQNPDGSYNFNGVTGYFQRGEQDQSYVPGFDASERTVAVSAAVKQNQPIVRAVTDELVSRLRLTVAVERNARVADNGDTLPADTLLRVELVGNKGVQASQQVRFTEKTSGTYYQDVEFETVPQVPFNIRVTRVTPDSKTDKVSNNTYFSSYVEIVDAKLSYPHTAFAALSIDSAQFGNNIPRRNYLMKGRLVKVPSNYNPETRQYAGGTWDGSFKTAWTNNPAWIFYDVLTQPRFSTLARRLNAADVDKWSLYQIGKYCDEPVDDGFGGKEPRFVCNAYITDLTQAGEFLTNLASVFTGLPVWNGQQMSVVMDADADPVAQYTNSNVKDGLFNYAGAALKSIHTAVHVQYIDKYDGYRTKTEYVADNEAVARYGLNIKQITAFGCDSRGQAARFGAWTLQTELRQQNAVTFEIGREGLKHLPYDIVQIMDNQYAGAELSGRVAAVSGNVLTLDRPVSDAVGALVFYPEGGSLKSAKVTAAKGDKVTLERAVPLKAGDTWVLSGKVKPRLYRAIGIKENTDEGTYTVTALLHDPKKYAAVDGFAHFDREITTLHNTAPILTDGSINTDGGAVVMTWDSLTANGQALTYDIKIYRGNSLFRHIPDAQTAEIRLENLPNGNYRAEIRGRNARGVLSAPLIKAWSIDYTVTGLRTTPKTLSVAVDWVLPQTVVSELVSELWYSRTNNLQTATKLATLPYPQNSYTLTGVGIADVYYFWVRVRDTAGNTGEFTAAVQGRADKNPDPIVQQLQGAIGKSALSQTLVDTLNRDMAAAAESRTAAEASARVKAVQDEARARTAAIQAEAAARAAEIAQKAAETGTRIAAVENVGKQQAQQIQTLTAAQNSLKIGGRNLLRSSGAARTNANYQHRYPITDAPAVGEDVTVTLYGELGADRTGIGVYNSRGFGEIMRLYKIADGVYQGKGKWILPTGGENSGVFADNSHLNVYFYPSSAKSENTISRIKLERGTVGTDWTPAPEDGEAATAEALSQAQRDAQTKADAAKAAAAAEAQAKAAAAKAAAIAAASNDAKAKADAAKAAAIADAAAKDAQIKREAAADAQTKADAVKKIADAAQKSADDAKAGLESEKLARAEGDKAEAKARETLAARVGQAESSITREAKARVDSEKAQAATTEALKTRIGNTESTITALRETVNQKDSARSSEINTLTAKLDNLQIGGRNLLLGSRQSYTVPAHAAANSERFSKRVNVAEGINWAEVRTLTLSVDVKHAGDLTRAGNRWWRVGLEIKLEFTDGTVWHPKAHVTAPLTTAKNGRISFVQTIPANKVVKNILYADLLIQNVDSAEEISLSNPKLEIGNVATAWTPAPEDGEAATSALSATVTQTADAVAELGGRVRSMYTLKTEAVSGGRRAMAGLALGADGQTGSGEILLMADKVGYVDPRSKEVTPAFVTVIENGRAKQALNGDLFATGSVLAKHIAAHQTIEAPTLNGATVNAGLINGGTIRGARIEAVDLEAANIVGDVVAVRTFELKQSPLGYQELICQIPASRKSRRTVVVPQVNAFAKMHAGTVNLQLYMDGIIKRDVAAQSAITKLTGLYVPNGPNMSKLEYMLSVPDVCNVSYMDVVDGNAHSLHILCRVNGNFDYSPLGDMSGIVCFIV